MAKKSQNERPTRHREKGHAPWTVPRPIIAYCRIRKAPEGNGLGLDAHARERRQDVELAALVHPLAQFGRELGRVDDVLRREGQLAAERVSQVSLKATEASRDAVQEILKRGAETGIFFAGTVDAKEPRKPPQSFELTDQDRDFLRSLSIRPDSRH